MAGSVAKLDKLKEDLDDYVDAEVARIDQEVEFLGKVRNGRGVGKVREMSSDFVEGRLVTKINDFLAGKSVKV